MADLSFLQMVLGIALGVFAAPFLGLLVITVVVSAGAALRWAWGVVRG